jgi:hypothetical protein
MTASSASQQEKPWRRYKHDRNCFRHFEPPPDHKPRPQNIQEDMAITRRAAHDLSILREIQFVESEGELHPGEPRKHRSDGLETDLILLEGFRYYQDDLTRTIGWPGQDGQRVYPDLQFLADRCDIPLETAEHGEKRLRKSGYVKVIRRGQGLSAVRSLTPGYYKSIGRAPEERKSHQKKVEDEKKRRRAQTAKERAEEKQKRKEQLELYKLRMATLTEEEKKELEACQATSKADFEARAQAIEEESQRKREQEWQKAREAHDKYIDAARSAARGQLGTGPPTGPPPPCC